MASSLLSWLRQLSVSAKLWYGAFILIFLSFIGLAVFLQFRTAGLADDAFSDGRRLIVELETGNILGKITRTAPTNEHLVNSGSDSSVSVPEVASDNVAISNAEQAGADISSNTAQETTEVLPATVSTPSVMETATPIMEDLSSTNLPAAPENKRMAEFSKALHQISDSGELPRISSTGQKPWQYYAKPSMPKKGRAQIAVVIEGLGLDTMLTNNAMRIHESMTLSFSPYTPNIETHAKAAQASGHEILIDLPLRPSDYPLTDPGPHGIFPDRGTADIAKQLEWTLSRIPVYIGVVSPYNENFSDESESFTLLLDSLNRRGLLIVLVRPPARDETKDILTEIGIPHNIVNVRLDEEPTAELIQERLTKLEQLATKNGFAVAVAQPLPLTIQQLRVWVKTLEDKDIELVPISAIIKQKFS